MEHTVAIAKVQVKHLLIYQSLNLSFNTWMNLYKRRQKNLLNFIATQANGSRVAFCNTYDMTESRLAQLLSDTYRDGKAFGERAARALEEKMGLEQLYFEKDHDAQPSQYPISTSSKAHVNDHAHSYAPETFLIKASARDIELLSNFNLATEQGKLLIEVAASTAPKDQKLALKLKKV